MFTAVVNTNTDFCFFMVQISLIHKKGLSDAQDSIANLECDVDLRYALSPDKVFA